MLLAIHKRAMEWNAKMIQYIIYRHVQLALVPRNGKCRPRTSRYPAMKTLTTALLLSLAACPWHAALSNELGEYGAGQASHVHGSATLQIVLENSALEIQLSSPAVNLLGFEGEANSPGKRASVDTARDKLQQPDGLFRVQGTECSLLDDGLQITGLPDVHGDEHGAEEHGAPGHRDEDHHDDDHHDDDEHHDDEHHDDDHHDDEHHDDDHHDDEHHDDDHHSDEHHGEDHHDGDHHDEDHSDIVAVYRLSCTGPDAAQSINLPLLNLFPGIEKLDVQWIVSGKQGARTLRQGEQTLRFR